MQKVPWYVSFFGEDYFRIYDPFLTPAQTQQEVQHIITLLNLEPRSTILDLGCGYGRHTLPLAQQGYHMTGQDLSTYFLDKAQQNAEALQVAIRWVHADMRSIPFRNEFDAVLNMFTSFGYFSDEENEHVLHQIHQALKPGGFFLLETTYQPRVVRTTTPHGIIRYDDGLIVLEERKLNLLTSRNDVHISLLHTDGTRRVYEQSIRMYTLTELSSLFARAGFSIQAYYGGLDRSPLTLDSRLVILSQKSTMESVENSS